jgi:hypothetical protein
MRIQSAIQRTYYAGNNGIIGKCCVERVFSTNAILSQHDYGVGPNDGMKLFCKRWLGIQE